jgi:hypothetical protein
VVGRILLAFLVKTGFSYQYQKYEKITKLVTGFSKKMILKGHFQLRNIVLTIKIQLLTVQYIFKKYTK